MASQRRQEVHTSLSIQRTWALHLPKKSQRLFGNGQRSVTCRFRHMLSRLQFFSVFTRRRPRSRQGSLPRCVPFSMPPLHLLHGLDLIHKAGTLDHCLPGAPTASIRKLWSVALDMSGQQRAPQHTLHSCVSGLHMPFWIPLRRGFALPSIQSQHRCKRRLG